MKMILANYINKVKRVKQNVSNCNFLSAIIIPFDMHWWEKKYRLLESEYFFYEFAHKDKNQRLEYVRDYECMNDLPNTFNNSSDYMILENKNSFNSFFADCIGREYMLVDHDTEYQSFLSFSKKHPSFICKPLNALGGRGICKIMVDNHNVKCIWNDLIKNSPCLLEEIIVQHPQMAALNPDTINSIRVVSMTNSKGEISIPLANVRIGRTGSCVDNFCSGGMSAKIDVTTGVITSNAYTKKMESYSIHPDTQCPILGYKIPEWENVLNLVKQSAKRLPELHYIGWDVAIKADTSVCLIEGNHNAGADVHQVAAGRGLRSLYEDHLNWHSLT